MKQQHIKNSILFIIIMSMIMSCSRFNDSPDKVMHDLKKEIENVEKTVPLEKNATDIVVLEVIEKRAQLLETWYDKQTLRIYRTTLKLDESEREIYKESLLHEITDFLGKDLQTIDAKQYQKIIETGTDKLQQENERAKKLNHT